MVLLVWMLLLLLRMLLVLRMLPGRLCRTQRALSRTGPRSHAEMSSFCGSTPVLFPVLGVS